MLKGLFIMDKELSERVYTEETREKINETVNIIGPVLSKEEVEKNEELLNKVEVIFSGWGAPVFDKNFLDMTPKLKVIFYGAGTMKSLLTDEVWERGIRVTTASIANSIPVAEFTLAEIIFSLKNGWQLARKVREEKTFKNGIFQPSTGAFRSTVGIISLSSIGKRVIKHLDPFDVNIIVYDPYASKEDEEEHKVTLVSLEELFKTSDVISIHSPLLPDTKGMITAEHFNSMKKNATFINTSRGAIIRENELIDVLKEREDLTALLDVTDPEPPVEDSLLYRLSNVVITPHIAGSVGLEIGRLGEYMYEEVKNYIEGNELTYEISKESYKRMA